MFNVKKTKFIGGGLRDGDVYALAPLKAAMNPRFTAPAWIDYRPFCIPASNQGATPHCAGYATAGVVEIQHWQRTGEQKQYDGDACYQLAKTFDGFPKGTEGTSIPAAIQAAETLGWIKPSGMRIVNNADELRYALHIFGATVCGFSIDENWNAVNQKTGFIGTSKNARSLGGHAVLVCYYDKDGVGIQNSWGQGYGLNGYCRLNWEQVEKQFKYGVAIEYPHNASWRR